LVGTFAAGSAALGQEKVPAIPKAEVPLDEKPFKPDTLFLTWQRDPTTTMTIQWVGKTKESDDPLIRFTNRGKDEWTSGPTAAKKAFPVVEKNGIPTGPADFSVFRAELTGLTPATEYEFRIGTMSPVYRFRTMPAKMNNSFTFITGGDCGVNV